MSTLARVLLQTYAFDSSPTKRTHFRRNHRTILPETFRRIHEQCNMFCTRYCRYMDFCRNYVQILRFYGITILHTIPFTDGAGKSQLFNFVIDTAYVTKIIISSINDCVRFCTIRLIFRHFLFFGGSSALVSS
jgi:hypothetical protein